LIEFETYKKEVKKLEDKANMMRDMHSYQFQKYEWISKLFSLIIIAFSAIVSILAVADPSVLFLNGDYVDSFRNLIAILAFLIFLISLSDKIYGIKEKGRASPTRSKQSRGSIGTSYEAAQGRV